MAVRTTKPGGQKGHNGSRLQKTDEPDEIININHDLRKLPSGKYSNVGYEARQVFDVKITRVVTEYRAQVLESQDSTCYVAEFPAHVKSDVQYGPEVKITAVYISQFQLLPYKRIQDQFTEQMFLSLSTGSIFNFNEECYELLEEFETIAKKQLVASEVLNVDETGIEKKI